MTQLFDVIHGVQHNRYLKDPHTIGRNILEWLGIFPSSSYVIEKKIIYSIVVVSFAAKCGHFISIIP